MNKRELLYLIYKYQDTSRSAKDYNEVRHEIQYAYQTSKTITYNEYMELVQELSREGL